MLSTKPLSRYARTQLSRWPSPRAPSRWRRSRTASSRTDERWTTRCGRASGCYHTQAPGGDVLRPRRSPDGSGRRLQRHPAHLLVRSSRESLACHTSLPALECGRRLPLMLTFSGLMSEIRGPSHERASLRLWKVSSVVKEEESRRDCQVQPRGELCWCQRIECVREPRS